MYRLVYLKPFLKAIVLSEVLALLGAGCSLAGIVFGDDFKYDLHMKVDHDFQGETGHDQLCYCT